MESTDNMRCFSAAIKDEPDWDNIDPGIVKKEVPSLAEQTSKADIKTVECLEFTSDTAPDAQVKVETVVKQEDIANDWRSLQLTDTKNDVKRWTVSSKSGILPCVKGEGGLEKLRDGIKTAYTECPRNNKDIYECSEVAGTYKEHTDSHQAIMPQSQSIHCGADKTDKTITPSVIVICPGGNTPGFTTREHTPGVSTGGLTPGVTTREHTPGGTTREHNPGGTTREYTQGGRTLSESCDSMKTPGSGSLFLSPRLTSSPPGGNTAQSITHEKLRVFDNCAKKSKQGDVHCQPSTGRAANKRPRSSTGKHSKVVPKQKKLALKEKCPCKCPVCGHSFPSDGLLLRHKQRHNNGEPYQCSVCQRHNNGEPYQCSVCQRHNNGEPYQCSVCQRHNNGEPYQCSVCQKLFCVKTTFHRHQLMHVWDEVKQVYDPL